MEGKPDLIIGNYTDGNLVASLMARKLGITLVTFPNHIQYCFFPKLVSIVHLPRPSLYQGTIAHALEKTKYEDSDIKLKELDPKYHFSCQFTADLIAMNSADFVITSTYQEIAGR